MKQKTRKSTVETKRHNKMKWNKYTHVQYEGKINNEIRRKKEKFIDET
jgi:hypothetical protein